MTAKTSSVADRRPLGSKAKGVVLRRWLRRVALVALVLGGVAILALAWLPKPLAVDTATTGREAMRVTVDEAARTRVKDRYVVSAPLGGDLLRVELRAGDRVAQGAVLARVMPMASPLLDARTRAEAEGRLATALAAQRQTATGVSLAEVALEHATKDAADTRRLAQSGAIATDALSNAELDVRLRTEQLASARYALQVADHGVQTAGVALARVRPDAKTEQLDVTAPAPGVVLRVLRESAGVVAPGTPIVEIGDPSALEITCDVLTSDAISIRPGAHVELERWGGAGPLAAHVRLVEPAAFTRVSALGVEEQRVNVVMDLDSPREAWAPLGDGFRLEARVVVWEQKDVLVVPASAVFRAKSGWAVYAVEGGRAKLVRVDAGHRNDTQVELLGGLGAGAVVIVHPSDRLSDGARVEAR